MRPRPLILLSMLSACAAPEQPDSADAMSLPLPGPGARVELDAGGLWLDDGHDGIGLSTERWGRQGALVVQPLALPVEGGCWLDAPGRLRSSTCAPSVERPLVGGVERWRRRGLGVQQGWTLNQAPDGAGPLVLDVSVTGATLQQRGDEIALLTPTGQRWSYSGLVAWDDHGLPLPASMRVEEDQIRISVDDAGATWPVHIDPLLSTATTTLSEVSNNFGIGTALGGDDNGDGYADVLIGARFGTGLIGEAFAYHGSSSGVSSTYSWKYADGTYYGKFAEYVDNRGDVNGDGYDDALIGEPYSDSTQVFHGSASGYASSATSTASGVGGLGRGVAWAGDWNNDGYDDAVIAASYDIGAWFYKGSSSGLNTTYVYSVTTSTAPAVSRAGDVNNNGYDDVIVGDASANAAYVMMGATSFPASTKTLTRSGSSDFGYSVTGGGDFDGDGYDDVAVGDPAYSSRNGRVTVYYGTSSGLSTSSSGYDTISAPVTGSGFGEQVQWVGDINGDGYDDLAVADDIDYNYVYIYEGAASGIGTTPVNSIGYSGVFGFSIGGGGDLDNDGYDDVAIPDYGGEDVFVYYGCPDADGDGECEDLDCDDSDAAINSTASEICDSVDNDCDGTIDDADSSVAAAGKSTWYRDADSDSYGVSTTTTTACSKPSGYVSNSTDCNDASSSVNPGATETTGDSIDSNCDNRETCYVDADNDNYRLTTTVTSTDTDCADSGEALATDTSGDCNDSSAAINPGATDTTGDGIDSNCDNAETCYADADNDNYRTTSTVSSADSDCADTGEALSSDTSGDCNDSSSTINPGSTEICDGLDNDCDSLIDALDSSVDSSTTTRYYLDADSDGYGSSATSTTSCSAPTGYVTNSTDCNDASSSINPGATETTGDGIDNNCDNVETCYVDADNDNYRLTTTVTSTDSDCADSGEALSSDTSGDCNDSSSAVHPGATETTGDGIDSDCDNTETCYADADADDYRGSSTVVSLDSDCSDTGEALSSLTSGDCDDTDADINPAGAEVCDGVDNDCDSLIDTLDPSNDDSTAAFYYADADGDGYGMSSATVESCSLPSGYAVLSGDCDDSAAARNPGETEVVADGIDEDCDDQEICYEDLDGDSYRTDITTVSTDGDCADSGEALSTDAADDCDDSDADIYPGAPDPAYDDIDQNCFGDDSNDQDGDGHDAETAGGDDCDDDDSSVYAGADETWYDGVDSDCGGDSDYDADSDLNDADAYGGDDCDDSDPDIYGGNHDTWYDGVDSDCGGGSDYDADADGHDVDTYGGDDCDDTDTTVYGGAEELVDGKDNDCDGRDETYDGDADGLTDLVEGEIGTDPTNPDTDGDSLGDGREVELGTDPLLADTDAGGTDDGEEVGRGSDPMDPADDDLPITTIKGSGCACASDSASPSSALGWLLALAPLALLRRKPRGLETR